MSKKDNGGPAFPRQHTVADANDPGFKLGNDGMTLRDYFAAKAMQGICAHPDTWRLHAEQIVGQSYLIADAMLEARKS